MAVTILIAACGCRSSDPDGVERTDSAGVEVVLSTGADRPLPWRLERSWTIGEIGDERLALSELAPHHVAAGPSGRVYVLDEASHRVFVLSPD